MGATNSIEYIPFRHIHISCSSNENILIENLKSNLESYNFLVTTTKKYEPVLINKAELILFCLNKNTMRTATQPSELYHCLKNYKKILFLYMDNDLEKMFQTYTTHHDSIKFMELSHIDNIEQYIRSNICDIYIRTNLPFMKDL
jgi:hypothetical protein